jgi:hypothetical protein
MKKELLCLIDYCDGYAEILQVSSDENAFAHYNPMDVMSKKQFEKIFEDAEEYPEDYYGSWYYKLKKPEIE